MHAVPTARTHPARRTSFTLGLIVLGATVAFPITAQQHDPSMHARHMGQSEGDDTSSPYVELTERAIKALSDAEVQGLRAGEGMGFALAAELNGYPGPKHVLEMADSLQLTADQRRDTQKVFDQMAATARALGEQLVEAESWLDRAFASGSIDAERLDRLTATVAELRGRLRAAHLRAHLEMMDILDERQVTDYARLRGYGAAP